MDYVRSDLVLPAQCHHIVYRTGIARSANGMARRRQSSGRNYPFPRWDVSPREHEAQHGHLKKRCPYIHY